MVIGNPDVSAAATAAATNTNTAAAAAAAANSMAHPSGIPQDKIDNIMSGIANTGDVKMNNHRKKLRQRFDIIKKLGQGTYGKVQLGINKETGQEVAIKTIKKCKIEAEADLVRIRREVQIMSSVQHPNIIHIYEVFENREKMVLVMEFAAGGELYDYLSERKVLSEEEAKRIFRQVATAVYYCHKHKICHRDLKLENILLDEHFNAKIADFGLSNVFDDQRLLATFCGSPLYASPEIVEGTPYQGPEVDCWSLGVLLYTLVYGSMPFDGSNFKRLVKQISQGDYYEPKKPSRASSLIRDMLTVSPRKRATIEQICSHWWVNENDNVSCLDLAESLANQTPVRLDVLLSLTPAAITADQLVVPSADGNGAKGSERVPRSHSVGSIRDMVPNTEAERRILDMVAAGGEAALMPSPTRTITPTQSPVQSKRKLETTVSMENAAGALKKKEKPGSSALLIDETPATLTEETTPMETEDVIVEDTPPTPAVKNAFSQKDMKLVGEMCEQLIQDSGTPLAAAPSGVPLSNVQRQKTVSKLDSVDETPEEKDATKVIKKFVDKRKTADLVNAIGQVTPDKANEHTTSTPSTKPAAVPPTAPPPFVRKCSLQDESTLNKFNAERRKSRILETAEKFQAMNASTAANGAPPATVDKPKKFVIPGVSVGSFKKEFERKASVTTPVQGPTAGERRALEQIADAAAAAAAVENESAAPTTAATTPAGNDNSTNANAATIEQSDSKNSVSSLSLEDARRSMENSIALLRQAQNESSKEVDQLCAKTENIDVSDIDNDRQRKLKSARAIIGNAIQPVIRRPHPPQLSGIGGGGYGQMRAISSGGYIDYGAYNSNNNNTNNNDNYDHNYSGFLSPPPTSYPMSPFQSSLPLLKGTPNAATLAAARQHIIGRLAAGRHSVSNPNSLSTATSIQNSFYNNSFSPQHQHQKQQQQLQLLQQQFLQNQQQKQAHHITRPSSYTAASATVATAANTTSITSTNNSIATTTTINSVPKPFYNAPPPPSSTLLKFSPGGDPNAGGVKTSTASITLKSATLPRRKTAKTEIQLEIKPRIVEQPQMRFTTEMQHPVADLRSAPARDGPVPYSPIKTALNARATSLEPKEHIIPIQRPPQTAYTRTTSNTTNRSGSLSRQSTVESESDTTTTTNMSQSTLTGSSQPIKKSPREFIIPIAVEGGGFITPREGSIEPSESSHTTSSRSTFSRLRPARRIGSLLNDADEGSPFQKIRTASINRDGDDDTRFTLHKLRSSRPVKKISQDNDSQSSGEEDDDDGFEILTAENLFSTLLQRVRALTNRLNVNNDMTSGFPNSSRLLSSMRQGQSPFWSQEPFGSRLNNTSSNVVGGGAPWRHSIARNLDSDMDSIFSSSGATLPRGNKISKTNNHTATTKNPPISITIDDTDGKHVNTIPSQGEFTTTEEPLDLADLDLSRLRLSKKDLETLSSITPGLPKCFQEQLLAKLPPTQARKLSRTLSMQNNPPPPTIKVYKRSQSGGRDCLARESNDDLKENVNYGAGVTCAGGSSGIDKLAEDYNQIRHRRSVSRSRYDGETGIPSPAEAAAHKSRSSSVCRDDYSKSLCSSYTTDINDKYKYYSPYLTKNTKDVESSYVSPYKRYESLSTAAGRPPSGCLSPPLAINQSINDGSSSSLRRRSSQRRISRFLRPDFFDEPLEENPYQREKKQRERETQSVLREIREKSREPSRDRLSQSGYDCGEILRRKQSLPGEESDNSLKHNPSHVRNKSMEVYSNGPRETSARHRRSLSRSRDENEEIDKSDLANKILQELQLLSAVRSQQEKRLSVPREISVEKSTQIVTECTTNTIEDVSKTEDLNKDENTATIKKVKKVKPKEKSTESSTDIDSKLMASSVVKKVKKIVKKSDSTKTSANETLTPTEEDLKVPTIDSEQRKKESKLKRPTSFPTKESVASSTTKVEINASKLPTKPTTILETNSELTNSGFNSSIISNVGTGGARESRLIRPKSYPASKLTPPKDNKKITRSGIAIPSIAEAADAATTTVKANNIYRPTPTEEKSPSISTVGRSSIDTSSSTESHPTTIKKIIKVTKKSKLAQPTLITPTTPTATTSTGEDSKESSPAILKEKSPEKKSNKGLLYAIGQKFEKLRDSAMNKEKKASSVSNSTSSNNASASKKSSPESSSPEKLKEKSMLLKKKKSLDNATTKTDQSNITASANGAVTKSKSSKSELEKPIKSDKRSRIDAMIRSLRERSVPRSHHPTESNYIKRAVSVEEMPGTFNKNAVNKVLGLFKRFEKDGNERRVQSTRSTSNIERQIRESSPSPIYENTAATKLSNKIVTKKKDPVGEGNCNCQMASPTISSCPECMRDQNASMISKMRDEANKIPKELTMQTKEHGQVNKDKRKGLMLDLTKLEKFDNNTSSTTSRASKSSYINGNGIYSNLPPYPGAVNNSSNTSQQSVDNVANNNNNNSCVTNNNNSSSMHTSQTSGYRTSSTHEINRNHLLTPSSENIANYSSDSRSYQDDCASTSTFLSPTEEPELYFDNWSVCSEDNYMLHATPSPTVSRLSRASQLSSPTRGGGDSSDPNESVIDRIKRRSFYCRFNEKKPKRTSSIVGPSAVRDYYREQQAAVKARSGNTLNVEVSEHERVPSPDITQQFLRPLKLSPAGTELKPPVYKSPLEYSSKPRKSLNDIHPSTSPSFLSKRYGSTTDNDYLSLSSTIPIRYKSSSSSSPNGAVGRTNSSYYNTYNPKRRSSYTLNGTLPSSSTLTNSNIDGYATVGRRSIRPYDQRTMSLLDPSLTSSSYRRETRTPVRDYTTSLSRSNSRYRNSSVSRSPTNI